MDEEPYLILCNPCGENVIAKDMFLLNVKGFKPDIRRHINNDEYVPLIIYTYYGKIYKCPECEATSGIAAPIYPRYLNLFSHNYMCSNIKKIPVEK
jgi:hypothetical protein